MEVEVTGAQAKTIAAWAEEGPGFVNLVIHARAPSFIAEWEAGDLLVTQGDAYLHVSAAGMKKDVVPSDAAELTAD